MGGRTDGIGETATEYRQSTQHRLRTVGAGAVGGFVGGVAMGAILHLSSNAMAFIGSLYGQPTATAGWLAHLLNSVVLGVLFVLVVSHPRIRTRLPSTVSYVVAGVIFATLVGLFNGGVLLPIAVNLIGAEALVDPLPPFPGVLGGILIALAVGTAHVVYGILLGYIVAILR